MTNSGIINKVTPLAALLLAAAMSSCSLMHDDLDPCPSGIDVTFTFDYNIERTNLFGPEIGETTVYVFDTDNHYVGEYSSSGPALTTNDYVMHLDLRPGEYRLAAVGGIDDYEKLLAKPGAKFRRPQLRPGDSLESLRVKLDRINGRVDQQGQPLDDHFQSMKVVDVKIEDMVYAKTNIEMMRLTNSLTVNFYRIDFPGYTNPDDFDITITASDGHIAYDNSLLPDEQIIFTPYATSTREVDGKSLVVADLNFARLTTDNPRPAFFTITDRVTGDSFTIDNLWSVLAEGRHADDYQQHHYQAQEYLDRQHNFEIDIALEGRVIKWIDIKVSVLNWSKRIQNINF